MIRKFLIEEVMLDGRSGDVSGTVHIDVNSGAIDQVVFERFQFQYDAQDKPASLDKTRLAAAMEIVDRVLEQDSDLGGSSSCYFASATRLSPSAISTPESKQALSHYLERVPPIAVAESETTRVKKFGG